MSSQDPERPTAKPREATDSGSDAAEVRSARDEDIEGVCSIYRHHVLHGTATFEEVPPPVGAMRGRWEAVVAAGLPFVVAEAVASALPNVTGDRAARSTSRIVGYAYAAPYRSRSAYRFTVESSVYLDPDATGRGIGRALMQRVIDECGRGPWRQMVAIIGDSANLPSILLHGRLGFVQVGILRDVGRKFDRWLDTVIMQRNLGEDGAPRRPERQQGTS